MVSENEDIADLESFASTDVPEPESVDGDIVDVGEDGPILPAPETDLMTVEEFKDVLRFGFDFPQTLSTIWMPVSIQPNEEGGFEAFGDALYKLLNRSDFTRKALTRSNSLIGEIIAVGSFGYMKLMAVSMILKAARAANDQRAAPDAPQEPVGQFDGLRDQEEAA